MDIEILDAPLQFHLHGLWSAVDNKRYAEVGMRLMDAMWKAVKEGGVPNTGINHWVYMGDERMFVGVEVRSPQSAAIPDLLQPFSFELRRYLKHLHVGLYQDLPKKWEALKTELDAHGEIIECPSLEIYGHCSPDPAKAETTILIGLK
jgi:hypothetical protein